MFGLLISWHVARMYKHLSNFSHFESRVRKAPYLAQSSDKIKKRFIQLSRDKLCIRWGRASVPFSSYNMSEKKDKKISENTLDRHVTISNIEKVIYGPRSLTWQKFSEHIDPTWRCLSIVVRIEIPAKKKGDKMEHRKRTIDLMFASENETLAWLIGLNYLVSESKKKAANISDFEAKRDGTINKKLSEYKWVKLRLQVTAFAQHNSIGVGKAVDVLVGDLVSKQEKPIESNDSKNKEEDEEASVVEKMEVDTLEHMDSHGTSSEVDVFERLETPTQDQKPVEELVEEKEQEKEEKVEEDHKEEIPSTSEEKTVEIEETKEKLKEDGQVVQEDVQQDNSSILQEQEATQESVNKELDISEQVQPSDQQVETTSQDQKEEMKQLQTEQEEINEEQRDEPQEPVVIEEQAQSNEKQQEKQTEENTQEEKPQEQNEPVHEEISND
jgi:hypothetical protein